MPKTLLPEHELRIQELAKLGDYEDADHVIDDALTLLGDRLAAEELWSELQLGEKQIEAGQSVIWSSTWSAEQFEKAKQRAAAGETPRTDVWP